MFDASEPFAGPVGPWCSALRRTRVHYDVCIVSCRPGHEAAVQERARTVGPDTRLLVVPEAAIHPGNLIGTLLAWRGGASLARQQGWDLRQAVDQGQRVLVTHAAGLGRRAEPLTTAVGGDRSNLRLPGRLGGAPTRLLTAVLHQVAPLATSLPAGFLDVVWASQLFVPDLDPRDVPAPTAPLSKLTTWLDDAQPDRRDVGVFAVRDGAVVGFHAQGEDPSQGQAARGIRRAADLGSFRLRVDLLDVLLSVYLDRDVAGRRDLDPDLTVALVGSGGRPEEARAVRGALGEHDVVGITALGIDIPWWRLRRPSELRGAALQARSPGRRGAMLRALLGVQHPVERSWLGDTWVEGPELGWRDVAQGIEVGGVRIHDALVHDSVLASGSRVEGSAVVDVVGAVEVAGSWVTSSGAPDGLRGRGGLVWGLTAASVADWRGGLCRTSEGVVSGFLAGPDGPDGPDGNDRRTTATQDVHLATDTDEAPAPGATEPIPPEALSLVRSRTTPGSALDRLADRAAAGAFVVAPCLDGPPTLQPERTGPPLPLRLDAAAWRRLRVSPLAVADALVAAWGAAFLQIGATPDLALCRWRRPATVDVHPEPQDVLRRIAAWRPADDPAGDVLAVLLAAVPPGTRPTDAPTLSGWLRWMLEHQDVDNDTLTAAVADLPAGLRALGFVHEGQWLPRWGLTPGRPADDVVDPDTLVDRIRARTIHREGRTVIGLCGPAAAGKSTLARRLADALHAPHLDGDAFTWPGDGFRYAQHAAHRDVFLWGSGIYDHTGLAAAIDGTDAPVVIVDAVYLGLHPAVRERLDLWVLVTADDAQRLDDKLRRDRDGRQRRIDVLADFSRKVLHESRDGLSPLVERVDLVWHRSTGALWRR